MRRAFRIIVACLAVAALTGCGDSNPSAPTAEDLEDIDLSPDHTIVVDDDGFDPSDARGDAGRGPAARERGRHGALVHGRGPRLDTGLMQPGEDTTLVLAEPGESSTSST